MKACVLSGDGISSQREHPFAGGLVWLNEESWPGCGPTTAVDSPSLEVEGLRNTRGVRQPEWSEPLCARSQNGSKKLLKIIFQSRILHHRLSFIFSSLQQLGHHHHFQPHGKLITLSFTQPNYSQVVSNMILISAQAVT